MLCDAHFLSSQLGLLAVSIHDDRTPQAGERQLVPRLKCTQYPVAREKHIYHAPNFKTLTCSAALLLICTSTRYTSTLIFGRPPTYCGIVDHKRRRHAHASSSIRMNSPQIFLLEDPSRMSVAGPAPLWPSRPDSRVPRSRVLVVGCWVEF